MDVCVCRVNMIFLYGVDAIRSQHTHTHMNTFACTMSFAIKTSVVAHNLISQNVRIFQLFHFVACSSVRVAANRPSTNKPAFLHRTMYISCVLVSSNLVYRRIFRSIAWVNLLIIFHFQTDHRLNELWSFLIQYLKFISLVQLTLKLYACYVFGYWLIFHFHFGGEHLSESLRMQT